MKKLCHTLVGWRYLNADQLRGFDTYKFYPRWLAPNVLTLAGWLSVMGCYGLVSWLDPEIYANSFHSHGEQKPLPEWLWLVCSVCTFMAHLLDGTDGKQARRTGASGPTGELFDHGLDSWSTLPFTITIFSVFGRGPPYSVAPLTLLCILCAVQTVFLITHWEKYNTGILFLSWGYDASQYGLSLFYLFTFFVGYRFYQFHLFGGRFSIAETITFVFYLTCVLSFAMSLYNICKAYFVDRTGKQNSVFECILPLVSPFALFAVSICWAMLSPTDVIAADPRTYFWVVGVVFSNTACRLIVAQMSSTRAQMWNKMFLAYTLFAVLSIVAGFLIGSVRSELFILRLFAALSTFAHVHYGVCLVRQLCDHFGIQAFSLSYLQVRNEQPAAENDSPKEVSRTESEATNDQRDKKTK